MSVPEEEERVALQEDGDEIIILHENVGSVEPEKKKVKRKKKVNSAENETINNPNEPGTSATSEKKTKRKRKLNVPNDSDQVVELESEPTPKSSSRYVSILITSHCVQCPLCDFSTKYHYNIARHFHCKHKEDYNLVVEGKKTVEGIRLKDPNQKVRGPNREPSTRKTPRKRPSVSVNEPGSSGTLPPILVDQQTKVDGQQQLGSNESALPELDLYSSENLDIVDDILTHDPSDIEMLRIIQDSSSQVEQAVPSSSSIPMDVIDLFGTNSNELPMDLISETVQSLIDNTLMPNLSEQFTTPSESTLQPSPSNSFLKNTTTSLPEISLNSTISPSPTRRGKKNVKRPLLTPEQLEARRKLNRERARERRMKEKLKNQVEVTPATPSSSTNDAAESAPLESTTQVALSESMYVYTHSPEFNTMDKNQNLPTTSTDCSMNSNMDEPVANTMPTESSVTINESVQSWSREERERIRIEKSKMARKNYYLKQKLKKQRALEEKQNNTSSMLKDRLCGNSEQQKEESQLSQEGVTFYSCDPAQLDTSQKLVTDESVSTLNPLDTQHAVMGIESTSTAVLKPLQNQGELDPKAQRLLKRKERAREYQKLYQRRKCLQSNAEMMRRRQLLAIGLEPTAHGDDTSLTESYATPFYQDYSSVQPQPTRKKKRVKQKYLFNANDLQLQVETNGQPRPQKVKRAKSSATSSKYRVRVDGEQKPKKRRTSKNVRYQEDYQDLQDDDKDYSDMSMGEFDHKDDPNHLKAQVPSKEKQVELHKCPQCSFTTAHGFSYLIHTKIHDTIKALPPFFLSLLNINDNMKRLLSEEPDVSRVNKYFTDAGFTPAQVEENNKKNTV